MLTSSTHTNLIKNLTNEFAKFFLKIEDDGPLKTIFSEIANEEQSKEIADNQLVSALMSEPHKFSPKMLTLLLRQGLLRFIIDESLAGTMYSFSENEKQVSLLLQSVYLDLLLVISSNLIFTGKKNLQNSKYQLQDDLKHF